MYVIEATNIRDALPKAFDFVRKNGRKEETRVGPAYVSPIPITIRYAYPKQHVLRNPFRDANPFFHLMEAMWMLAGRDDSAYLDNYIKNFSKDYAHDGVVLDAYGHRWRYGYRYNQLEEIINQLRKDPTTRQAVLQMWGAGRDDLRAYSSKPCNLTVSFRVWDGRLDMTVFNRSNDLIWGCCGANAVHFPILQEYMAGMSGLKLGEYWQVTTNLHLYESHLKMLNDRAGAIRSEHLEDRRYYEETLPLMEYPGYFDKELLEVMEMIDDIHKGEQEICDGNITNKFFAYVVLPMAQAHKLYRTGYTERALEMMNKVKAEDWHRAGYEWLERRNGK